MKKTLFILKKISAMALLFLPLLAVVSCHSDEPADKPTPEPVEEVTPRTVLVYIEAKNNLGYSTDQLNIDQMLQAAQNGDLGKGRLILFHSPNTGATTIKEVTATGIDTLYIYDTAPSAITVETMRNVVEKVKDLAPAKEYGLVLWSHAWGWLQDGITDDDDTNYGRSGALYSYGSEKGKRMNVTALASALEGQDLKFIYFDCCFMGNVETLYELRDVSEYFVASAAETPFDGMPYHLNMKYFFKDDLDLAGAAQSTYNYYAEQYANKTGYCPVTIAVVNAAGLDPLAAATREIYQSAESLYPSGYKPQLFSSSYDYFNDFEHYIKALCTDEAMLSKWEEALGKTVEYKAALPYIRGEIEIKSFCGLSTFILKNDSYATVKNYNTLSWYSDVIK